MGYLAIGETRKEEAKKRNHIAMWDFVVKGERERKREKKRKLAMPVRTECGVFGI